MRTTIRLLPIRALAILLCSVVLSGCLPLVAAREITYRPSPSDPYRLWRAYVTDSGLLYLCGSVDNDREGDKRVSRVYNLELRLEETLEPLRSDAMQTIQIDSHPSLRRTKGYLSDLCQFDKKRATKRPDETGWTEILLNSGDKGYVKVSRDDIRAGRLPTPPAEPRVVIYQIRNSDPPEYLLMGQLLNDGQKRQALLVLGSEHIKALW